MSEEDASSNWVLSDETWRQSHTTGLFAPVSFRNASLANLGEGKYASDIGAFLGAKLRVPDCSRSQSECRFYPGEFRFCPNCGKEFHSVFATSYSRWLPPFGNTLSPRSSKPSGLRLTDTPLRLSGELDPRQRAHLDLPVPAPGDFHFLVSPLGTRSSALIAVAPRKGSLYLWMPRAGEWHELLGGANDALSEWSLPLSCWAPVSQDLLNSPEFWVPTDDGLCRLTVDLVGLQYQAAYSGEGKCVGAPVRFSGHVLVPSVTSDGKVVVVKVKPEGNLPCEVITVSGGIPPIARFDSAIVHRRVVIWECSDGQLRIRERPGAALEAIFLAWPEFHAPEFRLGSPYLGSDDRLWRQCFNVKSNRYAYVELATEQPEIRSTDGPRFSTGSLSFRMGIPIKANPWDELSDSSNVSNEIVFPIVEWDDGDVVACMVTESALSVHSLLSAGERVSGRFAIRGDATINLLNIEIGRLWEARVFVYDGHLYLYHPDFHVDTHKIPGWRLEG